MAQPDPPSRPLPDNAIEVMGTLSVDQLIELRGTWLDHLPPSADRDLAIEKMDAFVKLRRRRPLGNLDSRVPAVPRVLGAARAAHEAATPRP